eukprot:3380994-Rhodomonas_salina.2
MARHVFMTTSSKNSAASAAQVNLKPSAGFADRDRHHHHAHDSDGQAQNRSQGEACDETRRCGS